MKNITSVQSISLAAMQSSPNQAWEAIKAVIYEGAATIGLGLRRRGYGDAPTTPDALFAYVRDNLSKGNLDPTAFKAAANIPLMRPKTGNVTWQNGAAAVGAALLVLFGAQQKPTSEVAATTEPPKSNNNTIIYAAIALVVVIGLVFVLRKK